MSHHFKETRIVKEQNMSFSTNQSVDIRFFYFEVDVYTCDLFLRELAD